jgi:NAD(P)-dependent dehydrogenase (short-subunit alcohol dehydrogenase family)
MTTILITGASSGIGASTALHLDAQGVDVIAGVLPADGDAALQSASPRLRRVPLDVTDPASVAAALEGVEALDGVVNNAGIGVAGPLEVLPVERLRETLEVNVLGQVAVTQAALPLLRRAAAPADGRARIVFVGSIGGRLAAEFGGAYHASKFALEALADVWRQELEPDAIDVVLIEPAAVATPIWSKAIAGLDDLLASDAPAVDRYRDRLRAFRDSLRSADDHGMDPSKVAEAVAEALFDDKPDTRTVVGGAGKLATALRPLIPDRLADRLGERAAS